VKRTVLVSAAIAVAAIAVFVVLGRAASTRDQAAGRGLETARAGRRDLISTVKATGVIRPMIGAEVRVGSRASGVVTRLFVRVGDTVVKGQLLAEIDSRELRALDGQAAAALASARVDLGYAEADRSRKRALAAAQLLAAADLDLAERAYAVAKERQTQAQAGLAYAATQLDHARIHAPIGGVVASVSTQEGETVAASLAAPTFVTLLDRARLEVWAYVDETDIGRIQIGQRAAFTVDTYPDHEFEGRVTAIYPRAEIRDNVVNYVAVVRFDPPRDRTLRPEMTTTLKIALDMRPNVLAVPRRALRREAGRSFVLCRRGDTTERRFVTTGARDEGYTEITQGLGEGDEVLISDAKPSEEQGR
jgi:RND family efflux transporter MFP subunit